MISLAEPTKNVENQSPLRMEDRLEQALSTLEGYVNRLIQENAIIRKEMVALQDEYAAMKQQYEQARQANDAVSARLDKSIGQLKLVLEEA